MATLEAGVPSTGIFDAMYAGLNHRVVGYFIRRGFDDHAALDLMEDTFLEAFESRGAFRGSTRAEQEAWIFAIARSQLSRHTRRERAERRRFERVGLDLLAAGERELERVVELAGSAQLRARVAHALAVLPPDQRRVLEAHVVHERPYAELALEWGVSEQVLRARASRGLRALAAVVTESAPAGS